MNIRCTFRWIEDMREVTWRRLPPYVFLRKDVRALIRLITYVPENIAHRNNKDFPGRPLGSVVEDEG